LWTSRVRKPDETDHRAETDPMGTRQAFPAGAVTAMFHGALIPLNTSKNLQIALWRRRTGRSINSGPGYYSLHESDEANGSVFPVILTLTRCVIAPL
jgi:hypothetical protein